MNIIAHRGNFKGKEPEKENTVSQILYCLSINLDIEIDVRFYNNKFYFGHDSLQEIFTIEEWVKYKDRLWIHCKDVETALNFENFPDWNYFIHENDCATLTSKNIIWCHPKVGPVKGTVLVDLERKFDLTGLRGVCSDNLIDLISE